MGRRSRIERLDRELESLTIEFRSRLVAALKAGDWGLFGQNEHVHIAARPLFGRSEEATELLKIIERIEQVESRLGYAENDTLYKRYLLYRRMRGANVLGEPRLARQFLEEIGEG